MVDRQKPAICGSFRPASDPQFRRHGVTVGFDERSAGFVWFFSFLVWFSQVKKNYGQNLVLLLDEPGLGLHAKAIRRGAIRVVLATAPMTGIFLAQRSRRPTGGLDSVPAG